MNDALFHVALLLLVVAAVALWVLLPWFAIGGLLVLLIGWLLLARSGRQALSVAAVGISTLRQRLGSASVIVIGIAGVVGVLIAMLAMGGGLQKTLSSGGSEDVAIVLRGGAMAETQSVLTRMDINAVKQAPGIAHDAAGEALLSGELVVSTNAEAKGSDTTANVRVRGVDGAGWGLRSGLKIVEGRKFKPGLRELVVGINAERQYRNMSIGDHVELSSGNWEVVGVFASGSGYDSELWGDRRTLSSAYRRGNSVQSILVQLESAKAYDGFKAALAADAKLNVDVSTTAEFFSAQAEGLSKAIRVVGLTVGIIMAIGAIFGALNCMFAAVASRAREIATLRAMGFRGGPVVVSVMLETMVLALLGGLLGAAVVWFAFNGDSAATMTGFTQVVFRFVVSPELIGMGLKWALAIGFIGGLFPAVRAARLPVTTALRES